MKEKQSVVKQVEVPQSMEIDEKDLDNLDLTSEQPIEMAPPASVLKSGHESKDQEMSYPEEEKETFN